MVKKGGNPKPSKKASTDSAPRVEQVAASIEVKTKRVKKAKPTAF
jgi:hypothetical protein